MAFPPASKPRPVVIHDNDPDGFGAAWAAWTAMGPRMRRVTGDRKRPVGGLDGVEVTMVDMLYAPEVMDDIAARAARLTVIDHHLDAVALADRKNPRIETVVDTGRSAAALSWLYHRPDAPLPPLLAYVEDHDLWRHALPQGKAIGLAIDALPRDLKVWDEVAADPRGIEKLARQGRGLDLAHQARVDVLIAQARPRRVLGWEVPVAPCPPELASDVLTPLAEGAPFAMGWRIQDGRFRFSLRAAPEGLDVAAVAESLAKDGGGHRSSAGGEMPLKQGLALVGALSRTEVRKVRRPLRLEEDVVD